MPPKSREKHSPTSLRFACEQFDRFLVVPRRIAEEMERGGVEILEIDYQAALWRAMADINRWTRACEEAWTDEMHRRGAFKAAQPEIRKKASRKAAKWGE
jgi:hypothetical protein